MLNSVFRSLPHFTRLKSTVLRVSSRRDKNPDLRERLERHCRGGVAELVLRVERGVPSSTINMRVRHICEGMFVGRVGQQVGVRLERETSEIRSSI